MANSTVMFSGINPEGRNSSKVLRPPGGGSSLGPFHCDTEEEVSKTKVVQQPQDQIVPPTETQESVSKWLTSIKVYSLYFNCYPNLPIIWNIITWNDQSQDPVVIETAEPAAPAPVAEEAPPPACAPEQEAPPPLEAAPVESVIQEDQCPAPPPTEDIPAAAAPPTNDDVPAAPAAAPTETTPEPVAAPPPAAAYTPPAAGVRGRVPPGGHSSGPFW